MTIRKQFLKSKPVCKVTFKIPETMANGTKQANLWFRTNITVSYRLRVHDGLR
jgi:hypothetical protein